MHNSHRLHFPLELRQVLGSVKERNDLLLLDVDREVAEEDAQSRLICHGGAASAGALRSSKVNEEVLALDLGHVESLGLLRALSGLENDEGLLGSFRKNQAFDGRDAAGQGRVVVRLTATRERSRDEETTRCVRRPAEGIERDAERSIPSAGLTILFSRSRV